MRHCRERQQHRRQHTKLHEKDAFATRRLREQQGERVVTVLVADRERAKDDGAEKVRGHADQRRECQDVRGDDPDDNRQPGEPQRAELLDRRERQQRGARHTTPPAG